MNGKINLLEETIYKIKESGHEVIDILFIGSMISGHECSWEEYEILADMEYSSGFGAQNVASDLVIYFTDGERMFRHEYDGSEGWEFSKSFKTPKNKIKIMSLFSEIGWDTLMKINT